MVRPRAVNSGYCRCLNEGTVSSIIVFLFVQRSVCSPSYFKMTSCRFMVIWPRKGAFPVGQLIEGGKRGKKAKGLRSTKLVHGLQNTSLSSSPPSVMR